MSLGVDLGCSHCANAVFSANITHNLAPMAMAAGIYEALWRPEEIGATTASDLIEVLRAGLDRLESNPDEYRPHNPKNGWGSYQRLVEFVRAYLDACEAHPNARVRADR
jgi:hypothetical protein